jgi:hypothetical protein
MASPPDGNASSNDGENALPSLDPRCTRERAMKSAQLVLFPAAALAVAFLFPAPAIAQRGGGGPLLPAYLASVTVESSRQCVMADGGCWIRFTATALNSQGNPYEGAEVTLELSHSNSGVVVHNFNGYAQPDYTDSNGQAELWASSTSADYSIGFRAVATDAGRTVRSNYAYVTFTTGTWSMTPSGTGGGSGHWTLETAGGTASAGIYVNSLQIGTNYGSQEVDTSWIDMYCEVGALRTQAPPAAVTATATGTGSLTGRYTVDWDGSGHTPPWPWPPGFSFRCIGWGYAEVNHTGNGSSTGWGGLADGDQAYATVSGAGWGCDEVTNLLGDASDYLGSTITPQISLANYIYSTALPPSVDTGAGGYAIGDSALIDCEEIHEHVLDGYPAP